MNNCRMSYFLTECGLAPGVKLNCTDNGFINVQWNAPDSDCPVVNCKAYLICDNGNTLYHDQVHSIYKYYEIMYLLISKSN